MTPAALPLKLSAASMRMAGYMIENNLRIAQAFGHAAVASNPFTARVTVKTSGSAAKSASETSQSVTNIGGSPASIETDEIKPVAAKQSKSTAQTSIKPPKASIKDIKKPEKVAKAAVAKPATAKPVAATPKSGPAVQAVKPVAKPTAPRAAAPIQTATKVKAKTASKPVIDATPVKPAASKSGTVAGAGPTSDVRSAVAKSRREPATPPSMPAKPKVQAKPTEKPTKK